jgi:general secretion pathway protein N
MNAAAQRKLTPVLAILFAVFAVILIALFAGVGRGVRWGKALAGSVAPTPLKVAPAPVPAALAVFADVWQRPLFSPDRKPAANIAGEDAVSLGDFELTGIILTPGLHMALLRSTGSGHLVRVREGSVLPDSHWTLVSLGARSAAFDGGGERKELTLKVAAPEVVKADAQHPANAAPQGMAVVNPQPVMQPPSSGLRGPVPPNMAGRNAASGRPQIPPEAADAQQQARIEAIKAAVQKRRAEQAAQSANEGVR